MSEHLSFKRSNSKPVTYKQGEITWLYLGLTAAGATLLAKIDGSEMMEDVIMLAVKDPETAHSRLWEIGESARIIEVILSQLSIGESTMQQSSDPWRIAAVDMEFFEDANGKLRCIFQGEKYLYMGLVLEPRPVVELLKVEDNLHFIRAYNAFSVGGREAARKEWNAGSYLTLYQVPIEGVNAIGKAPKELIPVHYMQPEMDAIIARGRVTSTDCRTPVGVTVGLIDGIIAMARVLRHADLSSVEVQEALKDIRADEDMAFLMGLALTDKEIASIKALVQ